MCALISSFRIFTVWHTNWGRLPIKVNQGLPCKATGKQIWETHARLSLATADPPIKRIQNLASTYHRSHRCGASGTFLLNIFPRQRNRHATKKNNKPSRRLEAWITASVRSQFKSSTSGVLKGKPPKRSVIFRPTATFRVGRSDYMTGKFSLFFFMII